ncbi:MAG: hypothetical protein NC548_33675 [Lachnospiraceae bacterium]|nr:hypothetical protein [Lachnospiraceae bacterium]
MILFIGTQESGFFIEETIKDNDITFTGYINITELDCIALSKEYTCIIIDISLWPLAADNIVAAIVKVAAAYHGKLIIYASGYSIDCKLCSALRMKGITSIITSSVLSYVKEEFLNFYNNETSSPIIIQAKPQIDSSKSIPSTIAVCGSQSRIGTTTQCIQIVKYLTSKGFKTAYLEFNNTGYVNKLKKLFRLSQNVFEGIELYMQEQISEIADYDYIVYDYGSIKNSYFNVYSFLERQTKIIVCGAKPDEIEFSTVALKLFNPYQEVNYLFNFVAKSDESDISSLMGEHKTYFSPLIPDSYSILSAQQELYQAMGLIKNRNLPETKKDKPSLFSRWRKNNG